jgi:uncharacterized phiE125 gp8 family phage protein
MTEPLPLGMLKSHLRLSHSLQDALLNLYISAAREQVEADTWRSLLPITGRVITRRDFPFGDEALYLPKPPLRAVSLVQYTDSAGTTQTLANYRVDTIHEPGSIEPIYPSPWPKTIDGPASVTVTYDCGYLNADAVPNSLMVAMLLIAAEMYENAEPVPVKINSTLDRLLRPYRVRNAAMLESVWTPKVINPKFPAAHSLWQNTSRI